MTYPREPEVCGDHDLAYGPYCMHCGQLMSPAWVASYTHQEPNRTYYEVYWPGPRELHNGCDTWGDEPWRDRSASLSCGPGCRVEPDVVDEVIAVMEEQFV